MPSYTSLTAPSSIGDAIAPLAILPPDALDLIAGLIRSDRSFAPKKDELSILSERLGLSRESVEYLFVGLSFLYNHVHSDANSKLEYGPVIESTVEELAHKYDWDDDVKGTITERLTPLLERNDLHDVFRKVERLRAGFQPHAVGFSSLVELRPRYIDDETADPAIDGYVPVIQFRITTDASEGRHHVFQLTESALAEFKKAVERLDKKIAVLKNAGGTAVKIIDL